MTFDAKPTRPIRPHRRASHLWLAACSAAVIAFGEAQAGETPAPATPTDTIGLAEALQLAQAALKACRAGGYPASVSVVDAQGLVKVTLRDDGAVKPPLAAPRKAATAAAFDEAGSDMEARAKADPAFGAQIAAHPDIYNDHPGSLPLHRNGRLVGGLAIADVPHDLADGCVRAALAQFPLE